MIYVTSSKTVLITGASRGIGRACALKFAKNGHRVLINYNKSAKEAAGLVDEIKQNGGYAKAYCADVSDTTQIERMFDDIKAEFGGVDILINNAGIAKTMMLCDMSERDWDEIFNVNVRSMFTCTRLALPYMIQNKSGKIVNISSIWGICGGACEVAYSASKAAVIGFTKALASEVGPSNICVNCVAPGVIDTDMNRQLTEDDREDLCAQTPLCRMGSASEIAQSVFFLASEKADFITGQVLSPNGGFVI